MERTQQPALIYAGIGARATPDSVLADMTKMAGWLALAGILQAAARLEQIRCSLMERRQAVRPSACRGGDTITTRGHTATYSPLPSSPPASTSPPRCTPPGAAVRQLSGSCMQETSRYFLVAPSTGQWMRSYVGRTGAPSLEELAWRSASRLSIAFPSSISAHIPPRGFRATGHHLSGIKPMITCVRTPLDFSTTFTNPVNLIGVMGAGLARAVATAYPDCVPAYRADLRSGNLCEGTVTAWRKPDGNYIIHVPTKRNWRDPSPLALVRASILALFPHKTSQNYRSPLNTCIDRVACGTTAYFYTDSYTADKALIKVS